MDSIRILLLAIWTLNASTPYSRAEFPSSAAIDKASKKVKETMTDLGDAFLGTVGRGTLQQDNHVMVSLSDTLQVTLERTEHLRTLAVIREEAVKVDAKLMSTISLMALGNQARIDKAIARDLKGISSAVQDAKDPAVIAVAGDIRDRVREVRDLWAAVE